MTITVDEKAIQEAVVSEVADRLIRDDDLYERAKRAFHDKVDAFFRERAPVLLEAVVTDAIKDGLDATYQPVDQFGRPNGEPTSIRERLGELARGYWRERVDRKGQPTASSHGSMTRAEWVMIKACGDDFHKEVRQEVTNVTADLKDGLRAELREWIDRTLSQLFHVRSADDQKEGRRS